MERATLGGVPGAGEVQSRRRDPSSSTHRGTFWFKSEQDAAMVELLAAGDLVEFEGQVNGQRGRLKARLTALSNSTGLAYFEGLGEPY